MGLSYGRAVWNVNWETFRNLRKTPKLARKARLFDLSATLANAGAVGPKWLYIPGSLFTRFGCLSDSDHF
jgi:hypothetical protein